MSTKAGGQFYPPTQVNTGPPVGASNIIDRNGNEVSVDASGNITDTTGKVALTIGGAGTSQTFTYTDANGHAQALTVNYGIYTVETAFGCSNVPNEYPPTQQYLVSSIRLADLSSYTFNYESLPDGNTTARLSAVQLPQGGEIQYSYPGANDGINCSDGSTQTLTRKILATSGSSASTWIYTRTQPHGTGTSHTEVVDGQSNYREYDFVQPSTSTQYTFAPATYYETSRQIYQGANTGTAVFSRSTCYNGNTPSCLTTQISLPITQIDTYDTYNGIETDGATQKYDTYGDLTESDTYDFGPGTSRGTTILRSEAWGRTYAMPGLPTSDIVYAGPSGSNIISQTNYQYDNGGLTGPSNAPQHVAVSCPCGNLITETLYANSGTAYTITNTYEDTGSILNSKFAAPGFTGATTTYTWDPTNFVYLQNEQLPTPSSGVALNYQASYDTTSTGLPLSSTDPNNNSTNITSYDEMLRPLTASYPDGGSTSWSYTPTSVAATIAQSSTASTTSELEYDAYGRSSRSLLSNGQSSSPYYQQDACYDADGRTSFVSYRYAGTGASGNNCATNGDTYSYDVLGRVTQVKHSDNTTQTWSYNGRATQFTDENGVSRITQVDGLGRPTIVCEIYSGTALLNSGSPASCGTDISGNGYNTTYGYSYDATSGNTITTIAQGAQTRAFWADWLGRPTKVIEPESGTTTYSYAYNATGLVVTRIRPQANQTGSSTTTTTSQYDSLGRIVSISYSDGTPTKSFLYDASAGWGIQSNLKGRLSEAYVSTPSITAANTYAYDAMGRVVNLDQCTPSTCGTSAFQGYYQYDFEGNPTFALDGTIPSYSYTYSPANEPLSVTSSLNDGTHPPNLLSNAQYGPFGPTSWTLGNGDTGSRSYDSMGRTSAGSIVCTSGSGCTSGTTLFSFSGGWTGNYFTWSCDSVFNQCKSYNYDAFGRLASLNVTYHPGDYTNFSYDYDRWGNRWNQNVTAGTGPQTDLTFDTTTNRVTVNGYTTDAAGNMTSDGTPPTGHSYTYDAEGNVTQVDGGQTATYTYNALNQRVAITVPGSTEELLYNPFGQHTGWWNPAIHWLDGMWAYWGTSRLANYGNNTVEFEHQDWLGTERARTNIGGSLTGTYTSFPFGDGYSYTGSDDDTYHYATLEQDTPSDEHAQFREYSNMAGRWFSPDPYQGSYDPTNPQSFNRYAYVLNNPLSFTDMAGLGPCDLTGLTGNSCTVWVFGGPIVGGGGGDRSEQGPGDPLIYLGSRHGGGAGTGSGHNNPSDPQTKQQKCESIYGNYVNAVADQREVNSISVAGAAFVGFAIGTKIGGPVAGYFSATGAAAAQFISEWDAGWNMDPINIEYASQLNNAGCFAGGWNTN